MATTADFVGRNCPHCGALDSLLTDDALGEVACMECALVVAMGLEENELTRYNKDATYDDADRHKERDEAGTGGAMMASHSSIHAAASAGGVSGSGGAKVSLHPAMLQCIRGLQKKSGVPEEVIARAVEIAKRFVGGRRARGQRLEKQQDVAAACFMIAADQLVHPVPLMELRYMDPSLGDVELRRAEVVRETKMEEEDKRLKAGFADALLRNYILKLGLQVSLFFPHCKRLIEAMLYTDALTSVPLVEKIIMSLLLARTSHNFQWEGKPSYGSDDPSSDTVCANFAARAHLDPTRVKKMLQAAVKHIAEIVTAFENQTTQTHAKKETNLGDELEEGDGAPETKRVKLEEF